MSTSRRAIIALLALYALLFVGLSLDILERVWDWRARFESPLDVAALFYFEGMRALTTFAGVVIACAAAARARARPGLQELPVALLCGTIAYTKLVAFRGFPGAQQERLAAALHDARVPPLLLHIVFAKPAWTALLAIVAAMLLLARFPQPLSAADVDASGARDRAGALRGVALAGADIGGLTRRAAAWFARGPWSRPGRLYPVTAAVALGYAAAAHVAHGGAAVLLHMLAAAAAAVGVAVCVALYRAGAAQATGRDAFLLRWLRRGCLAAGALFVFSGVTAVALRGGAVPVAALSLAPAAWLGCIAYGVQRTSAGREQD